MEKNVTQLRGGLQKDSSPNDRSKGTYQFALNAVNETETGDLLFVSNEESNEACGALPNNYIPLNKIYIGDNKTVIFSTSPDNSTSEIGVIDGACNYVTYVNTDLGFKIDHPIDATVRVRRGCETTIYWVDGKNNKPMYYVLEKPEQFQDSLGAWDKKKFSIQRSYEKIPVFEELDVLNSGGQIPPGSINVAVQYLDENLNPTEWITTSDPVNIYSADSTGNYLSIRGGINIDAGQDEFEDYRNFPITDKSIKVVLDSLDNTFLFYRLAFIRAVSGTGLISDIHYTDVLPVENRTFIYTGVNWISQGTIEEIKAFNSIIDSAGSIEQADNTLILGNVQGKQIDFCSLQSYASKITADMTTKTVLSNQMIDSANPKSPTAQFDGAGYMPGEIYSFGIVYVFEDGSQTPAYHIPGKNPTILSQGINIANDFVFTEGVGGEKTYPMSSDNQSQSSVYTDDSNCATGDYWGFDSMGESLKTRNVRHHRFPYRGDLGLDLVTNLSSNGGETVFKQVKLRVEGTLLTSTECDQAGVDAGTCAFVGQKIPLPNFQVRVNYTVGSSVEDLVLDISPADYVENLTTTSVSISTKSNYYNDVNTIVTGDIEETYGETPQIEILGSGATQLSVHHGALAGLSYNVSETITRLDNIENFYSTEIFGIKFSNVDLPPPSITGGEQVVGYYIVRNERTEIDKTILDSAVITPSLKHEKYISHGLLVPETVSSDAAGEDVGELSTKLFGVIHPEHKFNNNKYPEFTEIKQQGGFTVQERSKSKARYLDTLEGSGYDASIHKSGRADEDGWSTKAITRDNWVNYETNPTQAGGTFDFISAETNSLFYLSALESRDLESAPGSDATTVYNLAADNQIGMLELTGDHTYTNDVLPYVYLTRDVPDPYSTFRTLPYYKVSKNINKFFLDDGTLATNSATAKEFSGDTYVTPMRYVNTLWWDNVLAKRATQTSVWQYIIGAILLVAGTILLVVGVGAVVIGAGIAVIGAAATFVASGVKQDALSKAYFEEYEKGLRETVQDSWVDNEYRYRSCHTGPGDGPADDEIEWIADCVTDLWFESQINMSLRYGMTSGRATFLDSPGKLETGDETVEECDEHFGIRNVMDTSLYPNRKLDVHIMDKLLAFSPEAGDGKAYIGHPTGEYYKVNPDYTRGNKEKVFFHLPLEYDCCSDCQEDFPHRVHWSEQAFQEELSDNFRVFLPNNYKDIEGETGVITDLFRIKTNVYIHTERALWHQPQNFQERVTGDVVSFLGTGSYFNIPPRKILDGTKASAGNNHREGNTKTKDGMYFVSENEGKIYSFNGDSLEAISDSGMSNWFKENLRLETVREYYDANKRKYPYDNVPSSAFGVGFVSTYDTKKERLIFTKKDKILSSALTGSSDYRIHASSDSTLSTFPNYDQTLADRAADGWEFKGITEDSRLEFQKKTYAPVDYVGQQYTYAGTEIRVSKTIVVPDPTINTEYVNGVESSFSVADNSWTMSFSLKAKSWTSWHSYIPDFYYYIADKFYSWKKGKGVGANSLWKHNKKGHYQTFYGELAPFTIEYTSMSGPIKTKIWDDIQIHTEARRYNDTLKSYAPVRDVTFNKAIFYNTRQCTGELNLQVKDNTENYLMNQVNGLAAGTIFIDNNEDTWSMNDIRDIRVDYDQPIFDEDIISRQPGYYTDKILNLSSLDVNKDWQELESLRGKYLVIRLIFDTFDDVKLVMNYSAETQTDTYM